MPFKDPVCLQDGTTFDIVNILPYIRKFKKNPVTGLPLKASDLIKLNFSRNEDGEYHCPILYKSFNENSTIIAIKETGNVYSYEAYEQLNKKTNNFNDLLTNQPFEAKNIIFIQDPKNIDEKNIEDFHFIKKKEDIDFIRKSQEENSKDNFINLSSTYSSIIENYDNNPSEDQVKRQEVLNMINNRQNIEEVNERNIAINKEYNDFTSNLEKLDSDIAKGLTLDSKTIKNIFRISTNCFIFHLRKNKEKYATDQRISEGKLSKSFTSTYQNTTYQNKMRTLSEEELRAKFLYPLIKNKKLKGFLRINTNMGSLNIMLHCDWTPKTCENFIELSEKGYFNNVPFHRLVPNFVIQGGDPSGSGSGGSSIFGKPFEDEFYQKLTHKERGILSMANSGKNTNSSQFFITLKATPHLDNKHSVFGEVVGNYEILNTLEAIGADKKGTPNKEIKILSIDIFTNPYRDVLSEFILKEFMEKYLTENEKNEMAKNKKIEDNLKMLEDIQEKEASKEDNVVGKYLNKKRQNVPNYEKYLSVNIDDPYIYDKPKNKQKIDEFDFSEW
jgi:peptidyl-prolyl cis-trans isomerase-like protein 2